ncbi:hypothetical protein EXIGLDRAFT_263185 [Exidia glandulosa HHB12029]|uniref:Uncharacterized protein n=1 Tax=Exidia glandulosa HHB12029 TaxID=1314781 RepID=A0A165DRL9_EXIGL|nr:hypothetical protein EXIGLDRAFT_263185 [Exidia glandulosa HHB12029]
MQRADAAHAEHAILQNSRRGWTATRTERRTTRGGVASRRRHRDAGARSGTDVAHFKTSPSARFERDGTSAARSGSDSHGRHIRLRRTRRIRMAQYRACNDLEYTTAYGTDALNVPRRGDSRGGLDSSERARVARRSVCSFAGAHQHLQDLALAWTTSQATRRGRWAWIPIPVAHEAEPLSDVLSAAQRDSWRARRHEGTGRFDRTDHDRTDPPCAMCG